MFLMGLGALLVLGGILYGTQCYLAGTAQWPGILAPGSRNFGAATAQHAILRPRNELAGHSPYGGRRRSVGGRSRILASVIRAACKQ